MPPFTKRSDLERRSERRVPHRRRLDRVVERERLLRQVLEQCYRGKGGLPWRVT